MDSHRVPPHEPPPQADEALHEDSTTQPRDTANEACADHNGRFHNLQFQRGSYGLSLGANLPNLPAIVAVTCLFAAIAPQPDLLILSFHLTVTSPLITGIFLALAIWLILGAAYTRYLKPDTANETSYFALMLRLNRIEALLKALKAPDAKGDELVAWTASTCEARQNLDTVYKELKKRDLRWADATGYINAWFAAHAAEEALIRIFPQALVLEIAVFDGFCLAGSTIANRDDLLAQLKIARTTLEAETTVKNSIKDHEARAIVHEVRRAINDFRDGTWSGMVRARNRLIASMMATGILADLIIALAIIEGVSRGAIAAATMFFLVGAIVGCFSVLSVMASTTSSVEDYGLANGRLLMRPLYSGLAGIGGVVLLAMLSPVVTTTVTQAASAAAAHAVTPPPLGDIFDLTVHPFSLIVAAVFGLTPTLLLNRLLKQTEQYQADLKSSEPTNRAAN